MMPAATKVKPASQRTMTWKQRCHRTACNAAQFRARLDALQFSGECSEQKDTFEAATAGEARESISAAADCALLRQFFITRAEKHRKFLSGAVAKRRSICIIYL
jgi:hypothetical protein